MRLKHYVPIIAIFISIGAYLYTQQKQVQDDQDMNEATSFERILDVRLVVYDPPQSALIVIYNDGTIHYQVSSPDPEIYLRLDSDTISQNQFNNLANLITNNNFWSFKERYFNKNISLFDVARYTVLVKSVPLQSPAGDLARVHKVECLADLGCPEKIVEIIKKIKELWGKEILDIGFENEDSRTSVNFNCQTFA